MTFEKPRRGLTKKVAAYNKFTPLSPSFKMRVSFYGDTEVLKEMEAYLKHHEAVNVTWSTYFNNKTQEPLLQADINPEKYKVVARKANRLKLHIHSHNWRNLPS